MWLPSGPGIGDAFGPPGQTDHHFDVPVLSHETLEMGQLLNRNFGVHASQTIIVSAKNRSTWHEF